MVTTQRRARKKTATREAILRAGMELFAKHGLAAVTVDQIAEAADVGKGTIYNHFPTKEAIVVAFIADVERTVQQMLPALEAAHKPLAETLTEFVAMQWRMKRRHHPFVRVFFAQMFLDTQAFLPYMAEVHALIAGNITALFQRLQARGEIRPDVDIPALTMVFANMQLGLAAMWAIEGPPFAGTEMTLRREMEFLCRGIEAHTV